jgi:hypothetical protein
MLATRRRGFPEAWWPDFSPTPLTGMAYRGAGGCGSLSRSFAGSRCAAVTMFHVLEHLYDPVVIFRRGAAPRTPPDVQVPNAVRCSLYRDRNAFRRRHHRFLLRDLIRC